MVEYQTSPGLSNHCKWNPLRGSRFSLWTLIDFKCEKRTQGDSNPRHRLRRPAGYPSYPMGPNFDDGEMTSDIKSFYAFGKSKAQILQNPNRVQI